MQREALFLQQMHAVSLSDVATSALISSLLEANLFSIERGFEAVCSGVFEIQKAVDWRECFASRPNENCFARGITRFGVASRERLETRSDYRQEINQLPEPISDDEILLTAYQYGLSARKV
jgi:hypothetical protein